MKKIIQIIHSSEGISKNYPHKVHLEQSNMPEAVAECVLFVYYLFYKIMFY